MTARLRSDLQVSALRRVVEAEGLIFTVLHKGHEEGGMLFVQWTEGSHSLVFAEEAIGDTRGWRQRTGDPVPEADASEFIRQERAFDPDLWALEVLGPFAAAERILSPAR